MSKSNAEVKYKPVCSVHFHLLIDYSRQNEIQKLARGSTYIPELFTLVSILIPLRRSCVQNQDPIKAKENRSNLQSDTGGFSLSAEPFQERSNVLRTESPQIILSSIQMPSAPAGLRTSCQLSPPQSSVGRPDSGVRPNMCDSYDGCVSGQSLWRRSIIPNDLVSSGVVRMVLCVK